MPSNKNKRNRSDEDRENEVNLPDVDQMTEPATPGPQDKMGDRSQIDVNPIDPYTHEPLSCFPEGDIPIEVVDVVSFADATSKIPIEDEDKAVDFLANDAGVNTDAVMDQIDDYTDDPDILSDFAERQQLATGSDELLRGLVEQTDKGPELSGGDIDAEWEMSDVSGEESAGGSVATPDQSIVDDEGAALGITYDDDEELDTADKLNKRDEDRYELDIDSLEDYEDDLRTGDESREEDMDLDEF